MQFLERLDLDGNQLKEIREEFSNLISLKHLSILNNWIQSFQMRFEDLKELQGIELDLNENTFIDDSLFKCPKLKRLRLKGGKIPTINIWNLPSLEYCFFENCNFDYVENELCFTNLNLPSIETILLINIKTTKTKLEISTLTTLKHLHLSDTILQIDILPHSLVSFVYLNPKIQALIELPPNIYSLPLLEKIAIHKKLISTEELQKLTQHCKDKNIELDLY